MPPTDNQDAACELVREIVSARSAEPVELTERPDVTNRTTQAVEQLWPSPTRRYAVEHTRLETYDGQIEDGEKFSRLMGPLEQMLTGKVPGTFVLRIDVGAAAAARVNYEEARQEIRMLALSVAKTLSVGKSRTLKSDRLPFAVEIYRRSVENSKVVLYRGIEGDAIEHRRVERARRAIRDKCPKLATAASDGRISVLILESDDIALANMFVVNDAVQAALTERTDQPDQVFVVETDASPWSAWVLKEGSLRGDDIRRITGKPSHYVRDQVRSGS